MNVWSKLQRHLANVYKYITAQILLHQYYCRLIYVVVLYSPRGAIAFKILTVWATIDRGTTMHFIASHYLITKIAVEYIPRNARDMFDT